MSVRLLERKSQLLIEDLLYNKNYVLAPALRYMWQYLLLCVYKTAKGSTIRTCGALFRFDFAAFCWYLRRRRSNQRRYCDLLIVLIYSVLRFIEWELLVTIDEFNGTGRLADLSHSQLVACRLQYSGGGWLLEGQPATYLTAVSTSPEGSDKIDTGSRCVRHLPPPPSSLQPSPPTLPKLFLYHVISSQWYLYGTLLA